MKKCDTLSTKHLTGFIEVLCPCQQYFSHVKTMPLNLWDYLPKLRTVLLYGDRIHLVDFLPLLWTTFLTCFPVHNSLLKRVYFKRIESSPKVSRFFC